MDILAFYPTDLPKDKDKRRKVIRTNQKYYNVKYNICRKQMPGYIAEIGVRAGYSALAFLNASNIASYIGFDVNNGTHGGSGGENGEYFEWAKKLLEPYDTKLIELDTQKVDSLKEYIPHKIDLFHIDGDHTCHGTLHDLNLAYEMLSESGIILIDDIAYLDRVRKAVFRWIEKMDGKVVAEFYPSLRGEIIIRKSTVETSSNIIDTRLLSVKSYKRAMRSYVFTLYEIVFESRPEKMLEIGVMRGQSTKAILLAMARNKFGQLTSIDRKDRKIIFTRNGDFTDLEHMWNPIVGSSHDNNILKQATDNGPYDLLFIDGDHTYEGVKQDFEFYTPLVKPGGLILMHDICNRNTGVPKFWEEIKLQKIGLNYGRAGQGVIPGMGIIQKPKE